MSFPQRFIYGASIEKFLSLGYELLSRRKRTVFWLGWRVALQTSRIKLIKVCERALRLLNGSHPCGNIRPTQLSFVAYIYVFVSCLKKVDIRRCVKTSRPFSKGDFSIEVKLQ